MSSDAQNMESVQYKCPNCNADLRFNPNKQGFSCDFCDSFFTLEECKTANEQMQAEAQQTAPAQEEFAENNQDSHRFFRDQDQKGHKWVPVLQAAPHLL